jgi:hypothetical protein
MVAISKFPIESGGATRIIMMSICDILGRDSREDRQQLLRQSVKELTSLDKMARPGGVSHWIAGLQHWAEYLEFRDNSIRSRM